MNTVMVHKKPQLVRPIGQPDDKYSNGASEQLVRTIGQTGGTESKSIQDCNLENPTRQTDDRGSRD